MRYTSSLFFLLFIVYYNGVFPQLCYTIAKVAFLFVSTKQIDRFFTQNLAIYCFRA